jgi:peptidoglycan/xylan/chitin deacetylase (PgdA/CDA1 family)
MQRFQEHLDLIAAEGWHTGCVSDVDSGVERLPDKTLFITFDDGYADNFKAFECLADRGMKATWFVVAGAIGKTARWEQGPGNGKLMLDKRQLSIMNAAGMEIASHSYSHARLVDLDDERVQTELCESKACLEDWLGCEVRSLAYPNGRYDERIAKAAKDANYHSAWTCRGGRISSKDDRFEMRRIAIYHGDTDGVLARKLVFADHDSGWDKVGRYFLRRARGWLAGRMRTPK